MKKLLICLVLFAGCKKEDKSTPEPKPTAYLTFQEYPSGDPVVNMSVSVGFEKEVGLHSYELVDAYIRVTNNKGMIFYPQHPSGQYVRHGSNDYFEIGYRIPGYRYDVQPEKYGVPPVSLDARLTKKEGFESHFTIPLYRKVEATLRVKQVTPSSALPQNCAVIFHQQAFVEEDTLHSLQAPAPINALWTEKGVLLDVSYPITLYGGLYNSIIWYVGDPDEDAPYLVRKTPNFKTVNGQNIVTIEF